MSEILVLKQIREEIKARGIKVKFLASQIGVSPSTLSSYLTGKRGLGLAAKKSLLRELDIETVKSKAS